MSKIIFCIIWGAFFIDFVRDIWSKGSKIIIDIINNIFVIVRNCAINV